MTEAPNGASVVKKHKKRRRDEVPSEARVNGGNAESDIHDEKRREAKKRKKQAMLADGEGEAIREKIPEDDEETLGNKSAAKAARKLKKAQEKAARKLEEKANGISTRSPDSRNEKTNHEAKKGEKTKQSHVSSNPYQQDPSLTAVPQSEIDSFLATNFITIADPFSSENLRPITKFSQLPQTVAFSNVAFAKFKDPTPIQSAAWPFLLSGRDVIGVAETGSGKTLAFGVPCIRSISTSIPASKDQSPAKAVIVSPTRELAVQIHTQIEQLAESASLRSVCVYGGVPKDEQRAALKIAHIIVATPGRLNDLIEEGAANLGSVSYVVLDEADRMLDKGFEDAIRSIISATSSNRQTLMFTATWPPSVRTLASTFMNSPVHISIGANNPTGELRANTSITQRVELIDPRNKDQRLLQLLKQHQGIGKNKNDRILVFALYKKEAARTESFLRQRGLRVAAIHGDMSQPSRSAALESFKSASCPLLIATDVAARGLDIPAVKVVINLTFPLTVEDYVHRIGRTGRAGAEGLAITLFTEREKGLAGGLVNVLRAAGQEIPEELARLGGTVKKKGHEAYGAFYKDVGEGKKEGTKIRFDD